MTNPKHNFEEELFNFYKEAYDTELEREEKLLDRLNFAATQLAVLMGLLGIDGKTAFLPNEPILKIVEK
jgi:hypothetical protein